jgi:hypothetical protein
VVEVAIVATLLWTGWNFANAFAADDPHAWRMAVAGAVLLAAAEICRVPLVIGACRARTAVGRALLWLLVLAAASLTAKGAAQVTQQMYAPRLIGVTRAANAVSEAKARLATAELPVGDADIRALDATIARLQGQIETIGAPPKTVCGTRRDAHGRSYRHCSTPRWQGEGVQRQIEAAHASRAELLKRKGIAGIELAKARVALTEAEAAHDEAVLRSQLHSFASMLFGVAPRDVSDEQVARVLFWFVLVAGSAIALVGSGLAAASVTPAPRIPRRPRDVRFSSDMLDQLDAHMEMKLARERIHPRSAA